MEDPSLICLLVLHWYQSMEEALSLSPSMEEEEGEEHGDEEGRGQAHDRFSAWEEGKESSIFYVKTRVLRCRDKTRQGR